MKTRFFSLFVALIATMSVFAYDFQSGDLYYNITSDSTVEVTYQEWGSFDNYSELTSVVIPEFVIYNGTTYCVTSIGNGAFYYCRKLTNVVINNSITSISWYAFHDCSSLMSITIPSSVTNIENGAFEGCSNLASIMVANGNVTYDSRDNCNAIIETATQTLIVGCQNTTIPNSVTSIGEDAFSGCTGLASITIPNSVTSIGDHAFEGCSNLTTIIIPNSITYIGNGAFHDTQWFDDQIDGAVYIGNVLYRYKGDMPQGTSIVVKDGVTSIGDGAFSGCTGLTSVTIPNSVTNIGKYAFSDCTSLTSVTILNSVTSIGDNAFHNVPNVGYFGTATGSPWGARSVNGYVEGHFVYADVTKTTLLACSSAAMGNIEIPNSVTSIGDAAFYDCRNITSITIPDGVASIGESTFYGCRDLTSVTIPSSVTSIGEYAFHSCWELTSITIPDGITYIGRNAFDDTQWLYNKPDGILYIGNILYKYKGEMPQGTNIVVKEGTICICGGAFEGCSGLNSITISNSVTSLGERAFSDCRDITSVIWNARNAQIGSFYQSPFFDANESIISFVLGNDVDTIPAYLCRGMSKLTSIIIPDNVTSIGEGSFEGCRGITSIVWNAKRYISTKRGDYSPYESPFNDVCEGITSFTFGNEIDSIPAGLCHGMGQLTSIEIPNSVTSIGESAFSGCTSLRSVTIPNSVTSVGNSAFSSCTGLTSITIPNSVTSIGRYAFSDCSGLTSVTIPNSVTSLEDGAFYGCSGLTSITISNSVTSIGEGTFSDCSGLISVTIPNSVTSIGSSAFYHCSGLTSVTIPNSVTSIGDYAFSGCTGLTSITIPNSVTSIGNSAFSGCTGLTSITIPNSVTSIGRYAFSDCSNLVSISVPNSVTYIGYAAFEGTPWLDRQQKGVIYIGNILYKYKGEMPQGTSIIVKEGTICICGGAFEGCSGLASITIPNSVTSIGEDAFSGCTGLASITIPNSVTSLEDGAFYGCSGLTSITISNSVTSIGDYAFSGCTGLTSITISNSVTSIGNSAFSGCTGLTSITIPNNVTSIGGMAFSGCTSLTHIVIPNSVTSIEWFAFAGCSSLTSIVLGNGITAIAHSTFAGCTSLTSVTIPNNVEYIGGWAFDGCTSLTSVTLPNSITSIGDVAFTDCPSLKSIICYSIEPPKLEVYISNDSILTDKEGQTVSLYVPVESIAKYKAADGWKYFKILPISAILADVDEPVIDPESTTVTITWPATDEAATYTIEISKDGALVCTLTFDANGVLQNMRFAAPARHATQHTTQAEATGSGFRFVVEGLDYATTYSYTITAKDTEDKVVESYNGTFTTTTPTSTEEVHSTPSQPAVRKVFRNGQVYILRGDKTYTLTGEEL